jgi:hypothetical protein
MILPKWACSTFALPDKPMVPGHALGKVTRRVQHGFVDQDGITDAGELKTLPESGITSISLTRTDVTGTNQGNASGYDFLGFQGGFTRANGTTGTAETIYFSTDRRDTRADPTPGFTLAAGVDKLPQLPGSGQINSIAWKMSAGLLLNFCTFDVSDSISIA